MEREYGRAYEQLYRRHWWWRAREEYLVSLLKKTPLPAPTTILDVGCGGGWFFDRLRALGGQVEGVEPERALVSDDVLLRHKIHVGPFDRSFQPGKQYSLILMLDVLEHLDDAPAALAHAVELLEPEGVLMITVPAFRCLWTSHDDMNHHRTRYTKQTFARVADLAGMRIDTFQYFFHWLVPLKLAVRAKECLLTTQLTPPTVPPRLVNQFCYGLSRLEQFLCARLRIPAGSSLLVIGGRRGGWSSSAGPGR